MRIKNKCNKHVFVHIFLGFIGHYTNDHPDYYDCMAARTKLSDIVNEVPDALRNAVLFFITILLKN